MKAPTGKLAFAYHTIAELEGERDDMAQRCRELEGLLAEATAQCEFLDRLQSAECFRREKAEIERDTLRAEAERLREIREIAIQCAANGGYLCSRDLIELRELLKK